MIPSDTVMLPRTKLIIWQKKKNHVDQRGKSTE